MERLSPLLPFALVPIGPEGLVLSSSTVELPEVDDGTLSKGAPGWIVTVFNNDYNTYEEVMTILILATGCSAEEAYIETWEVDHIGSSVVHQGREDECQAVAEIISTIGIRVEVSQE